MEDGSHEKIVEKLLLENELCTLATSSLDGTPEAATIQFVADGDFNLYFETFPSYRKYDNLKENPKAAVVINDLPYNVQMEGEVEELSGEEADKVEELIIAEYGEGSGYLEDPEICFFRFKPSWIRLLVETDYPPEYVMVRGEGSTDLH